MLHEGARARAQGLRDPLLDGATLLRLDQEHRDGADPERALALAEESLALAGGASPAVLELIAYCHAAKGDRAAVDRTIRKILKLVGDEDKPYYEQLGRDLKGK